MDMYYRDWSKVPKDKRDKINFDHPSAFDIKLLHNHLKLLKEDKSIKQPIYNFKEHVRELTTINIKPRELIIVEGIYALYFRNVRDLFDVKIFVDTPDDIRFIRRLLRDIAERGRDVNSVIHQYLNFVRPMHKRFVEPTKIFADIVIPEGGYNIGGLDVIISMIKHKLSRYQ